jgi:hypothetical protein
VRGLAELNRSGRGHKSMSGVARITTISALCFAGWAGGAAISATPAAACPIAPGVNTCTPDLLTVSASATFVQGTSGTITTCPPPPGQLCFTADWIEHIYREPGLNALGCFGCLTWVVEVTNRTTSTDILGHTNIANFTGFATDMGYETNTPPPGNPPFTTPGTTPPNNVARRANGSTLDWDTTCVAGNPGCTVTNEIGPGMTSSLFEVETDAKYVVPGSISIQNGLAGFQAALGPATPEAFWVPLFGVVGGAAIGLVAFRRRRRERASPN